LRNEESSIVRKAAGAIIGFAILLGLLLAIALHIRPASKSLNQDQSQMLIELKHSLATVDDLEQRGILEPKVAEAERQRYVAQAQITLDESHIQTLIEIKYKLVTLDDLEERGILEPEVAQAERQGYLNEAQAIVGDTLDTAQLPILLEYLNSRQLSESQVSSPIIGAAPIPTIIWVLLGILLVAAAAWFAQPYLIAVRERLPIVRGSTHMPASVPQAAEKTIAGRTEERKRSVKGPTKHHLPPTRHRVKPVIPAAASFSIQADQQSSLTESLTKRELEVLGLVAEGLTNREIAQQLIITPGTAKVHISNIYSKLGVNRRVQAVAKAQELGILRSD
jgi:DNA-binding CsgD family transcriptional regulator